MKLIITTLVLCMISSVWAEDTKSAKKTEDTYSITIQQESNEGQPLNKSKIQTVLYYHNNDNSYGNATVTINVGTTHRPIYWEVDLVIDGYKEKGFYADFKVCDYQFLSRSINDGDSHARPLTVCKTRCKLDKSGKTVFYENSFMKLTLIFIKNTASGK